MRHPADALAEFVLRRSSSSRFPILRKEMRWMGFPWARLKWWGCLAVPGAACRRPPEPRTSRLRWLTTLTTFH